MVRPIPGTVARDVGARCVTIRHRIAVRGRASSRPMKPPQWLKVGDTVTLGIQGLGEQRQRILAFGAK